jgi:dCMP deaminase
MLFILDEVDQGGKTTLAKGLSRELNIPYIKLKNIKIDENIKIDDNVSIATHSQIETIIQLHEQGIIKDAILDRLYISEFVFSNLFERDYDNAYLFNIEERLKKSNDVILIRCKPGIHELIRRWKENEKLLSLNHIYNVCKLYDQWYRQSTLPVINIDTSNSVEESLQSLLDQLYLRGVLKDKLRPRRETHQNAMIQIAKTIARRSPDISRQVGAVLTENGFIVGVGYNGPPSGMKHDEIDIRKEKGFQSGQGLEFSRSIHAEQNAIMQSGLRNKSDKILELFSTTSPCIHCMRMLLQIGISKIYYLDKYNDEMSDLMAKEAGVDMIKLEG